VIACEDTGPGIPPAIVPSIFDPFEQGPRAIDRRQGGLGLGLALARAFTELHGGTIHFEPRTGGGSRFVVTLPLALARPEVESTPPTPSAAHPKPRKILVVDDNLDACEMLKMALSHAGHVVSIATDGETAIATAAMFGPEVAVLDIGLPGMNGYELARWLRASHPHLRLIALTGYGREKDVAAAKAAGFDAHCAKPIEIEALLERIDDRQPLSST
jgi:CheY-like chemotaxis protein